MYNVISLNFLEIIFINTSKIFNFPVLKKSYKDLNDVNSNTHYERKEKNSWASDKIPSQTIFYQGLTRVYYF